VKALAPIALRDPHPQAQQYAPILRDSLHDGQPFRKSELGKSLDQASLQNATPLYQLCPTALIFGLWDSTGPKGGLGAKFQRALVSEIIGVNAEIGVKTSSRIDPLGMRAALEWLEGQGAPQMNWPEASPRDVVKVYVPVNDAGVPQNPARVKESEMRAALGVMPDQRSRQERTFPTLHIDGEGPARHVHLRSVGHRCLTAFSGRPHFQQHGGHHRLQWSRQP
jgi:hypothetical protein